MLGEPKNQFSLTLAALSTGGRAKSKFLLWFALLLISTGDQCRGADVITYNIRGYFDGRDLLVIKSNTAQWHHLDFAAVGRYGGQDLATQISTTLNGVPQMTSYPWLPTWPEPAPAPITYQAYSSALTTLSPPLPVSPMTVTLTPVRARGSISIYQRPTFENDYTLILDFNDNSAWYADWYEAQITITPSATNLSFIPTSGPVVPELQALDAGMTSHMIPREIKAGMLALMKDGKLVFRNGYGWRDRGLTAVTHPDNLCTIASISKVITATAIQKLKDEGRLTSDMKVYPLVGILPYNGILGDSQITNITVQQCLDHTSGLADMGNHVHVAQEMGLNGPPEATDMISGMIAKPLTSPPGTVFRYTGSGYNYLGRVIEEITGKTFMRYLQEDLWGSYGITNIVLTRGRPENRPPWEIWYDAPETTRSAVDYPTNKLVTSVDGGQYYENQDAHAGLSASMLDLCRLMQHYFLAGSARGTGYGYGCVWGYGFFGGGPGNSSGIHQDVALNNNSLKALEFALAFNRQNLVNLAHDAIVNAANGITSWPAPGGGEIQWEQGEQSVSESTGSVAVHLVRSDLNWRQVKVSYTTYSRTAGVNDYAPQSGVLVFAPGETNKTVVVPITNHGHADPTKEFSLELISASGGAWLGERVTCMVYILDGGGPSLPVITSDPPNQTAMQGSNVTFSVSVSSGSHLTLQWLRNGEALSGATASLLTITNVQAALMGDYCVVAANSGGSITSAPANLLVLTPNNLQYGGLNADVYWGLPGGTVGELLGNVRYPDSADTNWVLTSSEIPGDCAERCGVRLSGFVIPPVSGDYTFYLCSDDQSALWLSTNDNPANLRTIAFESTANASREYVLGINQAERGNPPSNISARVTLQAGKRYYIQAAMKDGGGGNNLSFTWRIPGYPAPTNGSSPISGACLARINLAPLLTSQPVNCATVEGGTSELSVRVLGNAPLQYQWYHGATAISGATDRTLKLASTQVTDAGDYWVEVRNAFGATTSSVAHLTLPGLPVVAAQPLDQTVIVGQPAVFNVSAFGNSFQWRRWGTNLPDSARISGTHTSTLVISNVQPGDAGAYSASIGNAAGTTQSHDALLTVATSKVIGWGSDRGLYDEYLGQLAIPIDLTNAVANAAGWWHSLALRRDGTLVTWGLDVNGEASVPQGLSNVVALASRGGLHSLALRNDGTVVAWGYNGSGQTNVPAGLTNVVAVAAGQ
jgi:CubicO group peptidase (beta-lactamase class C family)